MTVAEVFFTASRTAISRYGAGGNLNRRFSRPGSTTASSCIRSLVVEVTARQGRRETGGTWTRPDIVAAALRVFPHVPGKFFDLITFEVKPFDGIDVTAVFEALSHRRAATQAYVWLHVPARGETDFPLFMP